MATTLLPFKLTADQLEERLPNDKFESCLQGAVEAVAALLEDLQSPELVKARHAYAKDYIQEALFHAVSSSSLPEPLATLGRIRKWAVEGLRDEALILELSSPLVVKDFDEPVQFPYYEKVSRSFTSEQARSVLANAFLGNCNDTMESFKDRWNQGGLDFLRLLMGSKGKRMCFEKLMCFLLYFDAAASLDKCSRERRIVFELVRFSPLDMDHLNRMERKYSKNIGDGIRVHNSSMESSPRICGGFVNFANANFGYGKLATSCTQEEILLSCCPESCLGMLIIGRMKDDEIVLVHGARRYIQYAGYSNNFVCQGAFATNLQGVTPIQTILTMDACNGNHFSSSNIIRDISKAYYAFQSFVDCDFDDSSFRTVSTGKWGCGSFGGLAVHKFLQQLVAATMANVDLDFSNFGDDEGCCAMLNALCRDRNTKPGIFQVVNALLRCKDPDSFQKDFCDLLA